MKMLEDAAGAAIRRCRRETFCPPVLVMLKVQRQVIVRASKSHSWMKSNWGYRARSEGAVECGAEHDLVKDRDCKVCAAFDVPWRMWKTQRYVMYGWTSGKGYGLWRMRVKC